MSDICCLCNARAELGKSQDVVTYGCGHVEHNQCSRRQNPEGGCAQCRKDRNKKGPTADGGSSLYLLGAYADPEYLRGAAWKAWNQRVLNAPVDFTTALESCPISRPGGGLPLPKEREIEVVVVDPRDLVMAGHSNESRTQGMVRMTIKQKQKILEIIRTLSGTEYPIEVLRQADITFFTLKQFITKADGTACSFLAWNQRTGLGPEDLVTLGARFRDLIDCGLNKDNANSKLISPDVYLGKPLFTRYGEILKELCNNSWKTLFRIQYAPKQLLAMGVTVEELIRSETFGWQDFRFLQYLGLQRMCEWGFQIQHMARIHAEKYSEDLDHSMFCAHFCTVLMQWSTADCARYLRVQFKAVAT